MWGALFCEGLFYINFCEILEFLNYKIAHRHCFSRIPDLESELNLTYLKTFPHWTFWDAILWMKNTVRNKQILSEPWIRVLDVYRKVHDIKLRKQSFNQNRKRQKQKLFLERVSKCPVRKVFRYEIMLTKLAL